MPDWMKDIFLHTLPKILMISRPQYVPRYSMEFEDPSPKKTTPINCIDNNSKATQVGPYMSGYNGLESPRMGTSPEFSQDTLPCDSDRKLSQDYIKQNGNVQYGSY